MSANMEAMLTGVAIGLISPWAARFWLWCWIHRNQSWNDIPKDQRNIFRP